MGQGGTPVEPLPVRQTIRSAPITADHDPQVSPRVELLRVSVQQTAAGVPASGVVAGHWEPLAGAVSAHANSCLRARMTLDLTRGVIGREIHCEVHQPVSFEQNVE
jgi:hypothetical protein